MKHIHSFMCSLRNLKFSEALQKCSSSPPSQYSPKEMVGKRLNRASSPSTQHSPQTTMTIIPLILNNVKSRLYCSLHCLVLRGEASAQEACTHTLSPYLHHSDLQHAERLTSHHLSYQNEYRQYHLLTLYYARFLKIQIWLNAMPNRETSTATVRSCQTQGLDTYMK